MLLLHQKQKNKNKKIKKPLTTILGIYTHGSDGKESACKARDPGLIPGLGKSPGEGNGNPLQYSCQENSMDGGDW